MCTWDALSGRGGKGSDSFVGGKIGRMRGAEFLLVRSYFRERLFFFLFGREGNLFIHSENFRGKKERLSRGLFLIFKKNFKCQGVLLRARVEKIACCG